jgi:hypothetical protein
MLIALLPMFEFENGEAVEYEYKVLHQVHQ